MYVSFACIISFFISITVNTYELASCSSKAPITMMGGSQPQNGGPCCWGLRLFDDMRAAGDMCYSYASLCGHVRPGEVLIHAGIMHAGRLWHLSLLPCSQAHLFGNGFTYIFLQMTPPLTAPTHTYRMGKLEATNMRLYQQQQRAFRLMLFILCRPYWRY